MPHPGSYRGQEEADHSDANADHGHLSAEIVEPGLYDNVDEHDPGEDEEHPDTDFHQGFKSFRHLLTSPIILVLSYMVILRLARGI